MCYAQVAVLLNSARSGVVKWIDFRMARSDETAPIRFVLDMSVLVGLLLGQAKLAQSTHLAAVVNAYDPNKDESVELITTIEERLNPS